MDIFVANNKTTVKTVQKEVEQQYQIKPQERHKEKSMVRQQQCTIRDSKNLRSSANSIPSKTTTTTQREKQGRTIALHNKG